MSGKRGGDRQGKQGRKTRAERRGFFGEELHNVLYVSFYFGCGQGNS
jgi:hypothetical protein